MNVVFVSAISHDNYRVQTIGELVESAPSHDRMRAKTIWLLGIENPNNVDEPSLIKDTFSGLSLRFDSDVFIYVADGDELRLYEVYKITPTDERLIVMPLGHWSGTTSKLDLSKPSKHERRRDLKVGLRNELRMLH